MQIRSLQFMLKDYLSLFLVLIVLFVANNSAFAHGKDHQSKAKPSDHMQLMMDVKKGIPEEYRIMERTPIVPDEKSLRQGEQLFQDNCTVCHGEKGDGNGPAATALDTPPANFLDKKHSAMYGPGEKYWIIANGSGETGMPGFSLITPIQRWHLVNYIFQLQEDTEVDLESLFSPG